MSTALPTGTVTFVFTDIEGSTRLVQDLGDRWPAILDQHDSIARTAIRQYGGHIVRTEGDSVFAVFPVASDAVAAAVEMQRRLGSHGWPEDGVIRARIGVHTGAGSIGGDDYVGIDVHRAARIAAAGHGGQIVVSEATAALVERALDPAIGLKDLGKHRLKDLAEREAIFQVVGEGLGDVFPPLRTLERVAHNFPVQATSFVGREDELAEGIRLLEHSRIVTLLGPGGTGKTRLSLQIAAECAAEFADGAFFVDLAPLSDPGLVPSAILSALGVPASTRSLPPRQHLLEVLAERSALLLLDNFEHVVVASDVVADLVRHSPGSSVLVTSQVPLRVAGEQEMPVAPLSVGDSSPIDPAAAAALPAVQLFVDRVTALDPSFALDEGNAMAVVELVRRLDGLPLAIELVVPQLRLLPVQAVLERLDPIRLEGGPRDAPERHQTLWNALAWSVETLSENDRRLLGILSVFAGGARLEEIESVCSAVAPEIDLLQSLGSLVERSLLTRAAGSGDSRFQWMRLIGRYGRELLGAEELPRVAAAHAAAYAALAETAQAEILTLERGRWLEALDRDHDNLRAALGWALDREEADLAFRISWAMWRFWQARGHIHEAKRTLERVLALDHGDPGLRAKAIEASGGIAWWEGDIARADQLYVEALELQRALGDTKEIANALYNRALALVYSTEDAVNSMELLREAESIYRDLGDASGLADVHWAIGGMVYSDQLSADESLATLRRAADGYAQSGNVFGEGWANFEIGAVLVRMGDADAAEPYLRRGLQLFEGTRDYSAAVLFVALFAAVAHARGQSAHAVRLAGAAYAMRDLSGVDLISVPVNQIEGLTEADLRDLEGELAVAHAEGRRLGYEEAVALALSGGSR